MPALRASLLSSLRPSHLFRSPFFRRPLVRTTFLTLGFVATCAPIAIFLNDNFAQLMWVNGPSMYPFLNTDYNSTTTKDVVFVNMWNPWKGLKRGMVVALWSPYNPEHMMVKRIIALEGDEVITKRPYPLKKAIVPTGHVWVEGEHPENTRKSLDSNTYGPVAKSLIVGKVRAVVWPWAKAGVIQWQDYRGSPRVQQDKHVIPDQYHFE
ncbi:hypothetical protein MMC30_002996 [Trapelia coarctata]|nr:hypothetical protein [Trapelia coarctata]